MGKILCLDLHHSRLRVIDTQVYAEEYLGGRGIASKLYWEMVSPGTGAFDPENLLIFMSGTLVATGAQAATRMSVIGKSPMTLPEGFCYGNMGGFFPAELKKAGYDGIIVEGRAPKPVYLWIRDSNVELLDATFLWGKNASQVEQWLHQRHGAKVRYITTGVAGENRVRSAVLVGSHDSVSNAGYGAVMGSKNLKAIAVVGTGRPSVADSLRLKELNRYTRRISKRVHMLTPTVMKLIREGDLKIIGKSKCSQCGMQCMRTKFRYRTGKEVIRKCQAQGYYLPWKYAIEDEPLDTICDAPDLANDYSICTMELRSTINWLYACYQSGTLSEKETGLPLSRIGTREFLEKLLQTISSRKGFGDILAEGLVRVREKVSNEAQALLPPNLAPIAFHDPAAKVLVTNAMLSAMEPREHRPILHHLGVLLIVWAQNINNLNQSPVTSEVFRAAARAFWGSEEAADMSSYDGKAFAVKVTQDRMCYIDSLGLCDFAWPITYSFNTPDHRGDPDLEAKTFSAVTGLPMEGLPQYGESIFNLQRAIQLREGRKTPDADFPPESTFTEPFQFDKRGEKMIVPGPGGQVLDAAGISLNREKYASMLKEYYRIRGWDEETGMPRAETLSNLGLKYSVDTTCQD